VHGRAREVWRPAVGWIFPLIQSLLPVLFITTLVGNVILIVAELVESIPLLLIELDNFRGISLCVSRVFRCNTLGLNHLLLCLFFHLLLIDLCSGRKEPHGSRVHSTEHELIELNCTALCRHRFEKQVLDYHIYYKLSTIHHSLLLS
jgi:hypothetical protein